MPALRTLYGSFRAVTIVAAVYIASVLGFAVAGGLLVGVLSRFGMGISLSLVVTASPFVGLFGVGYAIQQGWAN